MTKKALQLANDTMAKFIVSLCQDSDNYFGRTNRSYLAEIQYQRARDILKLAGIRYRKPRSHSSEKQTP